MGNQGAACWGPPELFPERGMALLPMVWKSKVWNVLLCHRNDIREKGLHQTKMHRHLFGMCLRRRDWGNVKPGVGRLGWLGRGHWEREFGLDYGLVAWGRPRRGLMPALPSDVHLSTLCVADPFPGPWGPHSSPQAPIPLCCLFSLFSTLPGPQKLLSQAQLHGRRPGSLSGALSSGELCLHWVLCSMVTVLKFPINLSLTLCFVNEV